MVRGVGEGIWTLCINFHGDVLELKGRGHQIKVRASTYGNDGNRLYLRVISYDANRK